MRAKIYNRAFLALIVLTLVSAQAILSETPASTTTSKKSKSTKTKSKTTVKSAVKSTKAVPAKSQTTYRASTTSKTVLASNRGGVVVRPASYRPGLIKGGPWREPTFADSSDGDVTDGEDPQVRNAAVQALGPYNGTVVVADPYTGRV